MPTFSVDQLLNTPLRLTRKMAIYRLPNDFDNNKKPLYYINSGEYTPPIYSWVTTKKKRVIMLTFRGSDGKFYYMPLVNNSVNVEALKEQGVKNDAEILAEKKQAERGIMDQIKDFAGQIPTAGKWIVGGALLFLLLKKSN